MHSIEQAREALARLRKQLDAANPNYKTMYVYVADLRAALASLSPSTPVDGVGAEPRVKPLEWVGGEARSALGGLYEVASLGGSVWQVRWNGTAFTGWHSSQTDARAAAQAYYEQRILSALASPEAEARLRERVDVTKILADVEAGKREVFVNKGEDPHGNGPDLNCPYCGGSGQKDDAEARLAQAEGGPAVTDEMVDAAFYAVLSCPHTIEHKQITIRLDPNAKGHNAAFQLSARLKAALHPQSAAGEEE